MRVARGCTFGIGLFFAAAIVACGGGSQDAQNGSSGSPAVSGPRVDATTAGNVKGSVVLEGTPPPNAPIKLLGDPICARQATGQETQETYVVGGDGKLANVFVYVKDGLGNYAYDMPTEKVTLDQKGCRYYPHVFGIRVGQTLEIVNSDPTLHNIHAIPMSNREFNRGQVIQGQKDPFTFTQKEVMIPFKCDVHGWMNAYGGVLDHPYFAVTTTDGGFDLKTLPPGTYTIEAWHEKLGTLTQSVTIGEKETKEVAFVFKVPAAATN